MPRIPHQLQPFHKGAYCTVYDLLRFDLDLEILNVRHPELRVLRIRHTKWQSNLNRSLTVNSLGLPNGRPFLLILFQTISLIYHTLTFIFHLSRVIPKNQETMDSQISSNDQRGANR